MGKHGTFSHKRKSSDQPSSDNVMPRRGRSASYQIQSKKILQDESLRSERSLQIDKSMVHHLDSMATTPGNRRPQRVLSDNTDASSITMTPGWPNYLDRTYNLRSYVQSSNRVSGGSSNNEGSGVIEDMLSSPDKRPRFRHHRGNLRPKKLGTELFTAAFTDAAQSTSIVSPPQPMGGAEISVEGFEEASPIFPKPFKRGRNKRTNPSVFQDAFEDSAASSVTSAGDTRNRPKESSQLKNTSSSQKNSEGNRSRNKHVQELEQQSDEPSGSTSAKESQTTSTDVTFTGATQTTSIVLPPLQVGDAEISVDGLGEASPIFPKPFKRGRNIKTNPSVFQDAFELFTASSVSSAGDSRNRPKESSQLKNTSSSQKNSEGNRSRNKHVQELEQQSDEPSVSTSAKESLTNSTDVTFTGATQNTSIVLPPLQVGDAEISVDGLGEASPIFPKPFKRGRNIRTNPSLFQDVFEGFAASSVSSAGDTRNRPKESSQLKNTSSSQKNSEGNRSRNKHVQELEQQSDEPSGSTSAKESRTTSTDVTFTGATQNTSIVLPPLQVGDAEISVDGLGEASPIFPKLFKRGRNIKTNPSVFQDAFELFTASSVSSAGDSRNRLEESSHLKSTSASPIRSQSNRSGNKHVQELEQKSVVPSDSGSPKGTQTKSTHVHPGPLEQINNAALTSLTQQSSINLPPQPGVGEICVEDLEGYSTVVSESSESREHVKTNLSLFQNASAEFVASSSAYIEHKDSRKTKDASSLASISRSNKEIGHDHTLAESSYVLPNSASFNKRPSTAGSISIHPGVSRGTEQNTVRSSTYKSVRLQNVAWFRRWQETAAAARDNSRYFNLLSKEERTTKLQEYVREVKNKHDEAHESKSTTKRPFVREVQDIESVEVIQPLPKKKVHVKPLHPALLVDGKPYRPHLKRPKSWATPRLYKLIIAKCEEKYGTLKARRKAENFIVHLCEKVSTVLRRKKYENYEHILEEIKISLYKLGVIKCLMEYFVFIEDYLPFNYRIKAIPCLRAYGKNTGPPLASDADLFVDLAY